MSNFVTDKSGFYVSREFLLNNGINQKTIQKWSERKITSGITVNNRYYILYSSIPERTYKKLPTIDDLKRFKSKEEKEYRSQQLYEDILRNMKDAYEFNFMKYRSIYLNSDVPENKITECARHHAVWQYFLDTYYSKPELSKPLKEGVKAYNEVYPGKLGYVAFSVKIKKALIEGIPSIIIRKKGQGRKKVYDEVYEYWVMQLASSGKAYSQSGIYREICEACDELGYKKPGKTTVKNLCARLFPIVADSRYGKDKTWYDKRAYTSILRAEYANDQYQIDGWRLPYYTKIDNYYATLCLFWVLDAHSGKIVGYKIGETENTELIMDGLEDAVRKTGALPYEIVSDNHSFNQTKIAENFKSTLETLGCTWTVTSNPRYKSLVERSFKTFGEVYCKKHYGYIGEGIKTKNPDGRISQELFDKYTSGKGWLTVDQIKAIAVYCISEFNKRVDKQGITAEQKYERSEKPHEIRFENVELNPDFYRLFTRDLSNRIVRKQQITIERSGFKYEYLLNSELAYMWNDKQVRVRYVDLSDGIYLYNPETDESLGFVHRKKLAHGALANRTEDDEVTMSITKSINKSVQRKYKEAQQELAASAMMIDPKAAELINQRTTPKNVVEELKKNSVLAQEFARNGGDMLTLTDIPVFNEANTAEPEYVKDKRKAESPFLCTEKIDLSRLSEY